MRDEKPRKCLMCWGNDVRNPDIAGSAPVYFAPYHNPLYGLKARCYWSEIQPENLSSTNFIPWQITLGEESMPGWPMGLPILLREVSDAFWIVELRNPALLEAARQTGFIWTQRPGMVCLAMNHDYFRAASHNQHAIGIISPPAVVKHETAIGKALIVCDKPEELYHFLHLNQVADDGEDRIEIDETAVIDASAVLRGFVRIGARVTIGPRAIVSGPVVIGSDTHIDAGAIVGCEGLYHKVVQGVRRHIPHFGGVEIGEGAFIHAGAVIVRSAIHGEATRIGNGAQIGILSNIGHDVLVGEAATISSNVVIAGRARVGARAWVGASSTVSNMIKIGADAEVRIGAVAIQDVPAKGDVSGNFAMAHGKNMKRFLKDTRNEP